MASQSVSNPQHRLSSELMSAMPAAWCPMSGSTGYVSSWRAGSRYTGTCGPGTLLAARFAGVLCEPRHRTGPSSGRGSRTIR